MRTSPDLYFLIHSLSKAEKRRFRLQSERPGADANYLRLFDAIAAQDRYNEPALRLQFAGEAFIRNFSVAKAYLYDSILQCLRTARTPASPTAQIRRQLDEIELLHQRNLHDQARKLLRKAIRFAEKQHLNLQRAELLRWERRLLPPQGKPDPDQQLAQLHTDESELFDQLRYESELLSLRARVRTFFLARLDLRKPAVAQRLTDLTNTPLLGYLPENATFPAREAWHSIHAILHRMHGDTISSLEHLAANHRAYDQDRAYRSRHPEPYLNALTIYLDACLRNHHFKDFLPTLRKMGDHPWPAGRLTARAFYFRQHLLLRHAITIADFAQGMAQDGAIRDGIKRHRASLGSSTELTLLYNLLVIHFLAGDYPATQRRSYELLSRTFPDVRRDIFDAIRLFELIALFERGEFDLLELRRRSLERRLRAEPRDLPYEKLLMRALRKLADAPPGEEQPIFLTLQNNLEAMPGTDHATGHEELVLWLQHRVTGIPIAALMQDALLQS